MTAILSLSRIARLLFGGLLLAALAGPSAAERVVVPTGEIQLFLREGKIIEVDSPLYSVFVADPEIADVMLQSPNAVYVFGRNIGETTVFLADETGKTVLGRTLKVTHNINVVQDSIDSMALSGPIAVRSVGTSMVLEGTLTSPEEIEDLRRVLRGYVGSDEEILMRVGLNASNQVNLRVRVAEVSRQLDSRLGINWKSIFGSQSSGVSFTLDGGVSSSALNPYVAGFQILTGGVDLNIVIDALSTEGLISILAEPNLTAISGEEASFLAGGEYPVPVQSDQDTVVIEYKQFGVSLSFTPTLVGGNRINLKVAPEVSELDFTRKVEAAGVSVPALTTRRASTTVELTSGQSFAIAGLLKSTSSQDVSKLPGLGDLPILGALFRSQAYLQGESELVIIVTPYLVRPVENVARFQLPNDGLSTPNELERLLFGDFQSPEAAENSPLAIRPRLSGSAGFILE